MRDLLVGVVGVGVGGVVGVSATLGLEAFALLVAAGLFFARGPEAAPAPEGYAAPATQVSVAAPTRARTVVGDPGEVQLHTLAMVRPLLDGEPMPFDAAIGAYELVVAPGEHRLQLLEPLGTGVKAELVVAVEPGRRTQLRYAKGQLSNQGTMPLSAGAPPSSTHVVSVAAAPPPTLVVTAPVATVAPVVTAQASGGGISISGPDGNASVTVSETGHATIQTGVGTIDLRLPKLLGGKR
jgi:hypothetical protein